MEVRGEEGGDVAGYYGGAERSSASVGVECEFYGPVLKFGGCLCERGSCRGSEGPLVIEDASPRIGGCCALVFPYGREIEALFVMWGM